MRSWKRYPKYKDSGVEWLGKIPDGWEKTKIGYVVDLLTGFPFKSELFDLEPNGIRLVRGDNVTIGNLRWGEKTRYWRFENINNSLNQYYLNEDDLLIGMDGSRVGDNYAIVKNSDLPLLLVQRVARLRSNNSILPKYLKFLISDEGFRIYVNLVKTDPAIPHISPKDIQSFPVNLPPLHEQSVIASFLDRETTRIDALIEKKQRQIELLQEKRAALISQAVTKGLDPTVPMKDSGVPWLGEVPEHWGVMRIASFSTKITNGFVGPTRDILVETGVMYLQSQHIDHGVIRFETQYFVTPEWSREHQKSVLKKGDVLIIQTGNDTGQVAVVPQEYEGANCHALIIVQSHEKIMNGEFLSCVLNSDYGMHSLKAIQTGALHPHLNCTFVRDVNIPVPPIDEQEKIIQYLEKVTNEISHLNELLTSSISLLNEYRSALISAAVTGKIDVRDTLSPPLEAQS